MEKEISFNEFQSVKSVAKAIDPIVRKRDSVKAKIESMVEEYKGYEIQINALEAGIVQIIGFHVEDLVKKVIEPDANGNRITKYLPTDIVRYDADKKKYIISTPDEEPEVEETPSEEALTEQPETGDDQLPWDQ